MPAGDGRGVDMAKVINEGWKFKLTDEEREHLNQLANQLLNDMEFIECLDLRENLDLLALPTPETIH